MVKKAHDDERDDDLDDDLDDDDALDFDNDEPNLEDDGVVLEAKLLADTGRSLERLGFRNADPRERRMLFQAENVYVELLLPEDGPGSGMSGSIVDAAGGWVYGQLIMATDAARKRFMRPLFALLRGKEGIMGAARATPDGDFVLPYGDPGRYELEIIPRSGPRVRVTFEQ